jgi:hypothetical protein
MGMARINVWITDLGDPCRMAQRDWVVVVFNCEGKVLEWCGKSFQSVPAKCGHVELVLPPGCYVIRATAHDWWWQGTLYGNWATDRAVVQACCDEHHCVTLYAPSVQACWIPLFEVVLPTLIEKGVLPKALEGATRTIHEAVARLPIGNFEKAEAEALGAIFRGPRRDVEDEG